VLFRPGLTERVSTADVILLLNKVDLMKKGDASEAAAVISDAFSELQPSQSFQISATRGDGMQELRQHLRESLPPGPWMYPEDEITTLPSRLIAAEVTREQLFLQLRQELPYAVAVDTISWRDFNNGDVRIDQDIYVQRQVGRFALSLAAGRPRDLQPRTLTPSPSRLRTQSQKGIVTGKGGARIKSVGTTARTEMEQIFQRRVHLFLHVKVRPDWQDRRDMYSPWGLNYNA